MSERPPVHCRHVHDHASWLVAPESASAAPEAPDFERIREHLALCPPCVEYVRPLGLTVELLRGLPGVEGQQTRAAVVALFETWAKTRSPGG